MEPKHEQTLIPGTASAEPVPLSPDAVVAQLRALREQIPNYTQLRFDDARSLARTGRLNPIFTQTAINAIDESKAVEVAVGRSGGSIREEFEEAGRWTAVEDELKALLRGVQAANLVRRHRAGASVLLAYNVALRLATQKEHEHLLPRVLEMKRLPKFGGKRKPPVEAPPTGPVPSAPDPVTKK